MKSGFKDYINVGSCANDSYAQHLGVMIYSLLRYCSSPERVRFFIMDGGISLVNKNKINAVVTSAGARITYLKPDYEKIARLKVCRYLGTDTYNRFSLFERVRVERLLYLDCDLVVLGDVRKLFSSLQPNILLGAVEDILVNDTKKKSLGMNPTDPYFNAGVLLINCPLWKKNRINEKVIDFIEKNPEVITMADQDGLNAILASRWTPLNPSWNVIARTVMYKKISFLLNGVLRSKLNKIKNVDIVHYAGYPKPWFFWHPIAFKKAYWQTLRNTPWSDYYYPDKNIVGFLKEVRSFTETLVQKIKNKNLL